MQAPDRPLTPLDLAAANSVRFGTSGLRGLVVDMDREVCFAFTSAFLQTVAANSPRVALAMDLRPSSPEIAAACAAAISHADLIVDNCGAIPTPALAYYAQTQGIPAIMVTGSHIPFDRNGMKFYGETGEITKADEDRILHVAVRIPKNELTILLPAVNHSARQHYVDRYLQLFPAQCLAGMQLGIYEHSSVARDLLREIMEGLGAEVISLGRTDEFVPIDTEAVSADDVWQARRWADEYGFDAIISTDGDGDRPLIGDELGNWFRGDIVGILCAQFLQAQAVVTTVSCTTAVELSDSFSSVIRTRIGSPYVIEAIDKLLKRGEKSVLGFEPNGGVLVGSNLEKSGRALTPLLTRDAVLPILCVLAMAREKGCKVSELRHRLPARFTASDRLQSVATETSQQILTGIAASPKKASEFLFGLGGKVTGFDQTDGLRLFLETDEIIHFRPSGNAPEFRCYAESASQERSDWLVQECLVRIKTELEVLDTRKQSTPGRNS